MYANTLFMCVCFEPRGCQLLTGGTDRRVAYWETGSGNLARELEASKVGAVNGIHISEDGNLFVTGGNDQMVKLWLYQQGIHTHMGLGHAGAVTCCRFSPDARYIVSACAAGSIIVWRVPEQYIQKQETPSSHRSGPQAAPEPESLEDELRLPLAERAEPRARRVPAAPSKVEKIEAINTSRSSVHSCCPCGPAPAPRAGAAPPRAAAKCCKPTGNKTG